MTAYVRATTWGCAIALILSAAVATQATFVMLSTENVPIDRIVKNLERLAAEQPSNIQTRINLGRIHAMAYAFKTETWGIAVGKPGQTKNYLPYFGPYAEGLQAISVTPGGTATARLVARSHLPKAISAYRSVLVIDPKNVIAGIGLAWAQDQYGDKRDALDGYRAVFAEAWVRENAGNLPSLQNFKPTTMEVAGYMLAILDPVADSAEIADITSKRDRIRNEMATRPITPIVIPLRDAAPLAALLDPRARVSFDADGSGIMKRWTWITPDAGWLVFDKLGRRQVTSALQWFGGVTFWLFWQDGYHALRALDDNDDGALTGGELAGLAIWRDVNANGVSDRGEVRPLDEWGIVRLSCVHDVTDDPDLTALSPAGVTFADGRTRPTYDVLLYPR